MAKFNVVHKKMLLKYADIIRMQILMYCFSNNVNLSKSEIDCLVVLCAYGTMNLSSFCKVAVERGVFKSPQTVRNFLTKAESLNLINKIGASKKDICLNDELNLQKRGNILLDYKMYYVTKEK